jgi:hypothetical protein
MGASYDRPDAIELLDVVQEFLREEVQGAVDGQLSFHVRVAVTALGIVQRELRLGAEHAQGHTLRLAQFGCADETELATRIRVGELDERYSDVSAAIRERVWAKLSIMNPKYATPYTSPDSRED